MASFSVANDGDWSSVMLKQHEPQWLYASVRLARSVHVQPVILLSSLLWTTAGFLQTHRSSVLAKSHKPPGILAFALGGQTLLAGSIIAIIMTATRTNHHWTDAASLCYVFILSLLRITVNPLRRRLLLHQINLISATTLLLLGVAEFLPLIVIDETYRPDIIVVTGILLLLVCCFLAATAPREWIGPNDYTTIPDGVEVKESKEETCSWMDYYFTFGRIDALMGKGWRKTISMGDLDGLPWDYSPAILRPKISDLRKKHKTTLMTILMFAWREICTSTLAGGIFFASMLIPALGVYQLLNYLASPEQATLQPYVWLLVMLGGELLQSITVLQFTFISGRAGIKLKAALMADIYNRALGSKELEDDFLGDSNSESATQRPSSAGQLANLMSTDVATIAGGRIVLMLALGAPIGIVVTLFSLYKVVGWPCLVGLVITFGGAPLPAWIIRNVGKEQQAVKDAQDSRISIASEYLGAIRTVKYFGWEDVAAGLIAEARATEQKHLWRTDVLTALMDETSALIPTLGLLAIYALYVGVEKQPLTAAVAFTTVRLLDTLRGNLGMLTAITMMIPRIAISFKRVDKFYAATTPLESHPVGPLLLDKVTFRRNKTADFRLQDISINFVQHGVNVIGGQSGSGKTTLLLSILGETIKESGNITRPRDVAYVSQTPWLQSQSIRENILFHSPFDADRYHSVIDACCLAPDLAELPAAGNTKVGEKGATISGGQRARVALASALYSHAEVVLLDNVFVALDSKTASFIWNRVFCTDLLKGRTVVLTSHLPWIFAEADLCVKLRNGKVEAVEQNLGVVRKPRVVENGGDDEAGSTGTNGSGVNKEPDTGAEGQAKSEVDEEVTMGGIAGRFLFVKYILYFGGPLVVGLTVLTLVVYNGLEIATTFWMSHWVDTFAKDSTSSLPFYLGIYIAISVASNLMHGVAFLSFVRGGWRAAKQLHSELISAVLNVSLSWYAENPVGRVINRVSGDMDHLDQTSATQLMSFLERAIKILLQTGAVSSILPVFTIPTVVVAIVSTICGEFYHRTATIAKRLTSSTKSPVLSQISETLSGLTVIRSQSGMAQVFNDKLNQRLYASALTEATERECDIWLKARINSLAALVEVSAGSIALLMHSSLPAGLVGFSLVTAGTLGNAILYIVHSMNGLDIGMQSFHRVQEYCKLPPEEAATDNAHDGASPVPQDWPRSGRVEFRNVTVRYTADGPDVLKDVNLVFGANERVAVVGRTGSGKSTLLLSLLGFTHIVSGTILYDGVDISTVSRKRLRRAITTIPQEAILFQGTVASNLDPAGDVKQPALQEALDLVASIPAMHTSSSSSTPADATTAQTASGLSLATAVQTGGNNFSHGQRQVLSLCRALVRKSRLLLLDEATSNMDYDTDAGIQRTLRREMETAGRDGCLITIAHRLRTITDYDKVVVMGSGQVLEVGSPESLIGERGTFYDMMQHGGESTD